VEVAYSKKRARLIQQSPDEVHDVKKTRMSEARTAKVTNILDLFQTEALKWKKYHPNHKYTYKKFLEWFNQHYFDDTLSDAWKLDNGVYRMHESHLKRHIAYLRVRHTFYTVMCIVMFSHKCRV
jgi:alkylhydroperoxidase family enzyme